MYKKRVIPCRLLIDEDNKHWKSTPVLLTRPDLHSVLLTHVVDHFFPERTAVKMHQKDVLRSALWLFVCSDLFRTFPVHEQRVCPRRCDCSEEYKSVCGILDCEDQLDYAVPFLVVSGRLCPQHYRRLAEESWIYKTLKDSQCLQLERCE